jgi:hypothetical protein
VTRHRARQIQDYARDQARLDATTKAPWYGISIAHAERELGELLLSERDELRAVYQQEITALARLAARGRP